MAKEEIPAFNCNEENKMSLRRMQPILFCKTSDFDIAIFTYNIIVTIA